MKLKKHAVSTEEITNLLASVSFAGFSLSLINNKPAELIFLSFNNIGFKLQVTDDDTRTEILVKNFQIDCQDMSSLYPVMIHPIIKNPDDYFFHLSSVKSNLYENIDYYTYYSLMMQELDIKVDGSFIFAFLDLIQSLPISRLISSLPKPVPEPQKIPLVGLDKYSYLDVPLERHDTQKMLYYGLYLFNPLKFNITFTSSPGQFLMLPLNAFTVLLQTFGSVIANLDRAPICLNALLLEHCFCSGDKLAEMISSHYTRQALMEIYKILGSTDLLGNPVGLFNNVASGVLDFFYEPAKGIVTSPQAFGKGLAKGTASLVKNSVFGVFNAVSKITGTVGNGVATLSLDDDYLASRQQKSRKKPKHVGDGALQGVQALGQGVFDGISGVVLKPIQGARKSGASGFAKGVGIGLIGIVVKPVAGVFEFASKTSEGVRNTATYFDGEVSRIRPYPRAFGPKSELTYYDALFCEGDFYLKQNGFIADNYLYHTRDIKNKKIYLISNKRLLILTSSQLNPKQLKESKNLSGTLIDKELLLEKIVASKLTSDSTDISVEGEKKPVHIKGPETQQLINKLINILKSNKSSN